MLLFYGLELVYGRFPEISYALYWSLICCVSNQELKAVLCTVPEVVELVGTAVANQFSQVSEQIEKSSP